jgi:hypothetical protein
MRGYVVEKGGRFYAVIYEGRDPITGRERRSWHAAGTDRGDAERLALSLAQAARQEDRPVVLTVARYLLHTWLPRKQISLRPSTWDGYRRNIESHVVPRIGRIPLRRLRGEHIDSLYAMLLANGRVDGKGGLDGKTMLEIHVILRKVFQDACRQGLVVRNVIDDAEPPKRRRPRNTSAPGTPHSCRHSWTQRGPIGCSPPHGSRRTPGCVAANCWDCAGRTSTWPEATFR